MDVTEMRAFIKGMDDETKAMLQTVGSRMGVKTTDEFYAKVAPEFIKIYNDASLANMAPDNRQRAAATIFQGRHVVKRTAKQNVTIICLDFDSERSKTVEEKTSKTQAAYALAPEHKKIFTVLAKDAAIAVLAKFKKAHEIRLTNVGVNVQTGMIFLDDDTQVEIVKPIEITEALLRGNIPEYKLKQLPVACGTGAKRNNVVGLSLVKVQSVGTPKPNGAYHTCYDDEAVLDLENDFPGFSVWVNNELGLHGEGSHLLVAYRAYTPNDGGFPKANALAIVAKLPVPYMATPPAMSQPTEAPNVNSVDSIFDL